MGLGRGVCVCWEGSGPRSSLGPNFLWGHEKSKHGPIRSN